MTSRKKRVTLTEPLKEFIIDKITEGMDVTEMCRRYPKKLPDPKTIYRAQITDLDFRDKMDDAYSILLRIRMEEFREVAKPTWVRDRLETEFNGDQKLAFEARRAKMDELKFILGKMAPVLTKRFDKAQKVEHSGDMPTIVIQQYGQEEKKEDRDRWN